MNEHDSAALLLRAARRASAREDFLGSLLARFQELEGCSELEVAKKLEVQAVDFPRLALCLRPRRDNFAQDVAALALQFGCNAAELGNLVRLVESSEAMRTSDSGTREAGLLIAARKRNTEQGEEGESDGEKK